MTKELMLVVTIVLSLLLIIVTFRNIKEMNIQKRFRISLSYLTLLFPLVGFIVVLAMKNRSRSANS